MRRGQRSDFARSFRKEPTEPERRLWSRLRRGQLDGAHFRRQVPVGHWIADFACARRRLVIEVDGDTHAFASDYDARRTGDLERRGWRVLRFWNNEVTGNLDGVVERILEAVQCLLPDPPPQSGEGMCEP